MNNREFKDHIYAHFSRIGKALASPTRLEILDLLCQGERTVEVLANQAHQTLANVSQHLKILKSAQLVKSSRNGNFITYQLANESVGLFWKALQHTGDVCLTEIRHVSKDFFSHTEELEAVTGKELLRRAQSGELILIDVRPLEEYNAGHIKGAISIPLDKLENELGGLKKNKLIVAYCRGPYCVLSKEAVHLLRKKGYKAYRLLDSVQDWKAKKLPIDVTKKAA